MMPTLDKVEAHFQQPELYLRNRVEIDVRRRIIEDLFPCPEQKSILDIGCGDGSISRPLLGSSNRVTLVDLSENMLQICRARTPANLADRVRFLQADFTEHDFGEQYDIVLCLGVLAHVTAIDRAVETLARLCQPGGDCILQLTDAGRFTGRLKYEFGAWYGRLVRGHGYTTNRTTARRVMDSAIRCGLVPANQRPYSVRLPGMKRLPPSWLWRWESFALKHRFLSRYGTELIIHFRKPSTAEISEQDSSRSTGTSHTPDRSRGIAAA